MAITETKLPYEFLVRWDKDGALSGAHVGFRTVITKDGQPLTEVVEPVQPVAIGAQGGFPLSDVLGSIESSALIQLSGLQTQLAEREATIETLRRQVTAAPVA